MKKLLIFIAGMVFGILLLFLISLFVANQSSNDGLRLFEEEGECVSTNSFQVIQVLDSGSALAREIEKDYFTSTATGITVLFLNEGNSSYYDEQIIKVPRGKCVKQIGVFKYNTRMDIEKTVPVVATREK